MPIYLRQSTASQEIPLGYFVDSTDGDTEEDGLTINNTDIKLWKSGATTLANKNSGGATHISNGIYYAVLDATDTDTPGSLVVHVHVAGARPVRVECVVYAANVYDSLIAGSDTLLVDSADIADAVWDEPLTGVTHAVSTSAGKRLREIQDNGTYDGGYIYIDTINGTAGTTEGENGTVGNPVDTLADATTLAVSLGLTRFFVYPRSTLTLGQAYDGYDFHGESWTLAFNGQSIDFAHVEGATISGTFVGTPHFDKCVINNTGIIGAAAKLYECEVASDITINGAGNWYFAQTSSNVVSNPTPTLDYGAAVGDTIINMRFVAGAIEIENMGAAGTDVLSIVGNGLLVLNANCVGGTVRLYGNIQLTDNSGGAVTVMDDARYEADKVADHTMRRSFSNAVDSANGDSKTGRSLLGAIARLVNKSVISGSTLTVYEDDDSTSLFTQTLTTDADADPVTGADTD